MQSLRCNLVLDGLPLLSSGNGREELLDVVVELGRVVNVSLSINEIASCYVSSSTSRTPPIIIKFSQQSTRDKLYFAYLRKRNLMLSDLVPEHNISSRLYLSEHITAECKLLLRRCAALKKKKVIARYSTRNCQLYYSIHHDDSPILASPQRIDELEEHGNTK